MQGGQEKLLSVAAPALIADALGRFGVARVRVVGRSMLPALRPGDVLFIERRALADVRIGDVLLFTVSDRLFAHRVVRLDGTIGLAVVTKGDTHRTEDLPIHSDQLLGQVVRLHRKGREVAAPFRYSRARSLAWLAASRCVELLALRHGG